MHRRPRRSSLCAPAALAALAASLLAVPGALADEEENELETAPAPDCPEVELEPDEAELLRRAATKARRPSPRVSLSPPTERDVEGSLDLDEARRAQRSDARLFAELGRLAPRMAACYGRVLRARPAASGSVTLRVTTREGRAVEAEAEPALDPELAACALAAFEGVRTAREYGTDAHRAVFLFCPSDRRVCFGDPVGVRAREGGDVDEARRALADALRARLPLFDLAHRRLGARAPRGTRVLHVRWGTTRSSGLGLVNASEDDDAVFDVLDPMATMCPLDAIAPRSSFTIPVWLGVR